MLSPGFCCLQLSLPHFYTLMHSFKKKKMLYVCILVSFDWNCWNILQSATSARHLWRGFSLLSSQCVLVTSKGENFSLVCNWDNNSSRGKEKKNILAGFLHPKLVKSFLFFFPTSTVTQTVSIRVPARLRWRRAHRSSSWWWEWDLPTPRKSELPAPPSLKWSGSWCRWSSAWLERHK